MANNTDAMLNIILENIKYLKTRVQKLSAWITGLAASNTKVKATLRFRDLEIICLRVALYLVPKGLVIQYAKGSQRHFLDQSKASSTRIIQ
ncbi:MAG: hypothetical protein M1816_005634 [Peltula sp. TS41687]|nr:MAG: hypothetical protein M1816_005634 [Peltula sp. TS41687]